VTTYDDMMSAAVAQWSAHLFAVWKAPGSFPGSSKHASCVLLIMKAAVEQWLGIHC